MLPPKQARVLLAATIVIAAAAAAPSAALGAVVPKDGYWKGTATPAESYDAPKDSYRIDWMVADRKLRRSTTGNVDRRPGRVGALCRRPGGFSGTEFRFPNPSPLRPTTTGRFTMTTSGSNELADFKIVVSGRFTSSTRASGTYRYSTVSKSLGDAGTECTSGSVPWTASWRSRSAPR